MRQLVKQIIERKKIYRNTASMAARRKAAVGDTSPEVVPSTVTKRDLDNLERELDALYAHLGMDVEFTRHFFERIHDKRNGDKPIDLEEIRKIFVQAFKKHGRKMADDPSGTEAVLNDINTKLNVPFVLKWSAKKGEIEVVSKTIMRKQNFKSSSPKLQVEGIKLDEFVDKTKALIETNDPE